MLTTLLLALAQQAEPPPPPLQEPQGGTRLETAKITSAEEGDAMVYRISELFLEAPDLVVRADRVTIWLDGAGYRQYLGLDAPVASNPHSNSENLPNSKSIPLFTGLWSRKVLLALGLPENDSLIREIRLEGHVEIVSSGVQLFCDRLQNWPADGHSLASVVEMNLPPGRGGPNGWPVRMTADEVKETSDGLVVAHGATLSTCLDRPPHYSVRFAELVAEPQADGDFVWHPSGGWLQLGGFSVLPVPTPDFSPDSNFLGFRGVVFGSSRRLGNAIAPRFGGRTESEDGKSALDWTFEPTYSSDRGFPLELRLEGISPGYKGTLDFFYLNDEGSDQHGLRRSLKRNSDTRTRLRWYNRWTLDDRWLLDANLALTSDPLVDPEFFQNDWTKKDDAESQIFLRRRGEDSFLSANAIYRLDDIGFTPIEGFGSPPNAAPQSLDVLPVLSYDDFSSSIWDIPTDTLGGDENGSPLNFSWGAEVGNFQLRDRNILASRNRTFASLPTVSRTRGRFWSEAAVPFHQSGLFFRPGVRVEGSVWEDDTVGAVQEEQLFTEAFLETGIVLEKRFEDGWRHLVLPQIRFRSKTANRKATGPVFDFDGNDLLHDGEVMEFSLRQFYYAPNSKGPWLDVNLLMPWYTDASNLLQTSIAPFPRGPQNSGIGPAELRITWTPGVYHKALEGLRWDARLRHDFERGTTEELFTRITVSPDRSIYYGADYYEARKTSLDFGLASVFGGVRISEEWAFGFRQSENFAGNAGLRSAYATQYYGHDFLFEFGYQLVQSTGEKGVYFNISPRFFADSYGSRDLARLKFQ
ncbi:MAG: hypothetical protein QM477_04240 [Planctomycetota bacterium]